VQFFNQKYVYYIIVTFGCMLLGCIALLQPVAAAEQQRRFSDSHEAGASARSYREDPRRYIRENPTLAFQYGLPFKYLKPAV
jgi:hypothetical protein